MQLFTSDVDVESWLYIRNGKFNMFITAVCIFFLLYPTCRHSIYWKMSEKEVVLQTTSELPCRTLAAHFCRQIRSLETQNVAYFSLLQSGMGFEIVNSFSCIFKVSIRPTGILWFWYHYNILKRIQTKNLNSNVFLP